MAGPSIVVRVLGDLTGLGKSLDATAKQSQTAGSRIHGAFQSVLGTLNATGVLGPFGESLQAIDNSLDNVAEHAKGIGTAMLGVGGTLVGVGLGLTALGSKDQAAHQQLQAAVEATGRSYDDYADKVEAAIKAQEKFGDTANQTQDALRILTQATGDPTKALSLLSTATDLAAAKHEGLTEAATSLGKVYNGNTRLLKEFGITVTSTAKATTAAATASRQAQAADDALSKAKQRLADLEAIDATKKKLTTAQAIALRNAEQNVTAAAAKARDAHQKLSAAQQAAAGTAKGQGDAVAQLSDKLKGQASASADTFTGKLDAVKAKIEDVAATFGQKYGPAVTAAGTAITGLGSIATAAGAVFSKAQKGAAASTDLVTGALEGEQLALEGVTGAEVAAETAGLPLYATIGLVAAALVALGVAAYEIATHWSAVWAGMKKAADAVWLALLHAANDTASALRIAARDTRGAIIAALVDVVDFAGSIPAKIGGFFKDLAAIIVWPFRTAFNDIADIWNRTVGSLSFHIPSWIPGIGGDTFSVPQIPHLAQGGLITQSGLVYAHAGEAITPMPARLGPAVAIQNATFSSEVDVDLFMRRAAWVIKTQAV